MNAKSLIEVGLLKMGDYFLWNDRRYVVERQVEWRGKRAIEVRCKGEPGWEGERFLFPDTLVCQAPRPVELPPLPAEFDPLYKAMRRDGIVL